jgi:hypothetical protein
MPIGNTLSYTFQRQNPSFDLLAFTLNTHSHIIEAMQSEVMALLDGILPDAVSCVGESNANLTPGFRNLASMAA